jgi:hypothetical protein
LSIVRSCCRIAAVAALRDRAWQDVQVFDSDATPLAQGITATPSPYIVVYTDDDDTGDIEARSIAESGHRSLSLVIEVGIAAALPALPGDEINGPRVMIPATDAAYEIALDVLDRQAGHALLLDPRSTWGSIFRELVPEVISMQSRRGGSSEKGVRWAARQRTYIVRPIMDPTPGFALPATHPVAMFLAAANAAAPALGIGGAAQIIADAISQTNDWSWRQVQSLLGLTEIEVEAIGIAPAVDIGDIEAPVFEQGYLVDEDRPPDEPPAQVPPIPADWPPIPIDWE